MFVGCFSDSSQEKAEYSIEAVDLKVHKRKARSEAIPEDLLARLAQGGLVALRSLSKDVQIHHHDRSHFLPEDTQYKT